jgi:hypothetical protein
MIDQHRGQQLAGHGADDEVRGAHGGASHSAAVM